MRTNIISKGVRPYLERSDHGSCQSSVSRLRRVTTHRQTSSLICGVKVYRSTEISELYLIAFVESWKYATLREKVVFRWKPPDDDTVFSRLGNTRPLREKSGVPLNPRGSFFRRLRHFELCSSTQQPQSAFRGNHLTFPTLLCAFSLSAPPPVPTRTP